MLDDVRQRKSNIATPRPLARHYRILETLAAGGIVRPLGDLVSQLLVTVLTGNLPSVSGNAPETRSWRGRASRPLAERLIL
jgi:hypothetical protein